MPERWVCAIANGFWEECEELCPELNLESSNLLESLSRASKTKHEFQSRTAYEEHGLKIKVTITALKVGMDKPLPFLKPSDLLRVMSDHGKLQRCLCGGGSLDELTIFWERYQRLFPQHPVFRDGKCLRTSLPILIHADEGRCVKKEQILVINWQSMLGRGTRLSHEHLLEPQQGLNYMGKTYSTRFLVATMCSLHYRKKQKHGHRLTKLLDAMTDDFIHLYEEGITVSIDGTATTLYLVPLAFKGDWPMLAKFGNLTQHFGKKGRPTAASAICHLCKAGSEGVPYEEYEINSTWYDSYLKERPWSRPPPFSRLPLLPEQELFFQFDIFHVMHKGIVAEFVGSAIAPRFHPVILQTF